MLIITLVFYLTLLLFFFLLPDHYLEKLLSYIKQRLQRFQSEERRASDLMKAVFTLERQGFTETPNLPRYKDFTSQCELLLELHRRLGVPLKKALARWKKGLIEERKRARILKSRRSQGLAQAVLMLAMTWTFIAASTMILGRAPATGLVLLCLGLPLTGVAIYGVLLKWGEAYFFTPLNLIGESLTRLDLLKRTGLSSSQLLGHLNLEQIQGITRGNLQTLKDQYLSLLGAWRERGVALTEECEVMIEEVDFLFLQTGEKLMNMEKALKLGVLMIFFLVPYLLYLLSLVASFLVE